MKSKTKNIQSSQNIIGYAGAVLVILTIVSSVFYAINNWPYMGQINIIMHYLNYILVIGGGFLIGYLVGNPKQANRLYSGTIYSLLTFGLFVLIDQVRVLTRSWDFLQLEHLIFTTLPLIALIFTTAITIIIQKLPTTKQLPFAENLLVSLFLTTIIIQFVSLLAGSTDYLPTLVAVAILVLTLTLLVMLFRKLENPSKRLIFAVIIVAISHLANTLIWQFNTDPSMSSYNLFRIIATGMQVGTVVTLAWLVRRSLNQ